MKVLYSAPEIEVLELKCKGILCDSQPSSSYRNDYGEAVDLD